MKDDFNAVNECLGFGTPAVPGSFNGAFLYLLFDPVLGNKLFFDNNFVSALSM